jgi:hypothetical protein
LSCVAAVGVFAATQFVATSAPKSSAQSAVQTSATAQAAETRLGVVNFQFATPNDREAAIRIASSLRQEALTVAKARSGEKAIAKARARARARARELAKERAIAKANKVATPAQSPTVKSSTQAAVPPLMLSLSANVAPNPNFMTGCATPSDSYFCLGQEVESIDNARALEGLGPMTLSLSAFSQMSATQQIFVLTDLERTARGLAPALALTSQLDVTAESAAQQNSDPSLKGWTLAGNKQAVAWNSNWSGGMSATESDYYWMYSDGTGFNVDCTASVTTGCWEHRANILATPLSTCGGQDSKPQFVMGAAETTTATYSPSETEILVQVCGGLPSDTVFTWAQAESILGIPVS